jgi:hypothetical protein
MRLVETHFSVPQRPEQVWSVLTDHASYPRWNSFIRKVLGELSVGRKLTVTIRLPSGRKTAFKAMLLAVDANRELSWLRRLVANGVFDSLHYWRLSRGTNGGTDVVHGERFDGLLVRVIRPERIRPEFERMNRDMRAELAWRYPPVPAFSVAPVFAPRRDAWAREAYVADEALQDG